MQQIKISHFLFLVLCICIGCRKKPDPAVTAPAQNTEVKLAFNNYIRDKKLVLGTGVYSTDWGDSFSISRYQYYISNVKLLADDGQVYTESNSYHLISAGADSSTSFTIKNLSPATYKSIEFMIGVDSIRNISGAQTGALDPSYAMFWDWNSGYIMAKMEGEWWNKASSSRSNLLFHIGGFRGQYKVLQTVKLYLPAVLKIQTGEKKTIVIKSDISEWFKTPNKIELPIVSVVASECIEAVNLSQNYADMFQVDSIE